MLRSEQTDERISEWKENSVTFTLINYINTLRYYEIQGLWWIVFMKLKYSKNTFKWI